MNKGQLSNKDAFLNLERYNDSQMSVMKRPTEYFLDTVWFFFYLALLTTIPQILPVHT